MNFIGIDPGKNGAIASLDEDRKIIFIEVMKDIHWFCNQIKNLDKRTTYIFLEKAQAMPKNGSVAMFNYGVHFGELMGVLICYKIPFELVSPQTWTKIMHIGTKGDKSKIKSAIAVKRIFPHESLVATARSTKPHEGLIDALLLAEYGRRKWIKDR